MLSRAETNALADWWWTVDRALLGAVLVLMGAGLVLSFAASPPVAEDKGVATFHYVIRHAIFIVPALVILIAASFLDPRRVLRIGLMTFVVALAATVLTLFIGVEVNGSRRWIAAGPLSLQPVEFLKPGFVILVAFLLCEGERRPDLPGRLFAILVLAIVVAPLIAQPDFGQAMLIALVWCAMIFLAGLQWFWVVVLGLSGFGGIAAAYVYLPHVTERLNAFLDPTSASNYQVSQSIEAFMQGGWFGRGPGEGVIKHRLPDSHNDFVFAVAAEEFGIVGCALIASLFAFVVVRGLVHAVRETDTFVRLALSGLILTFGLQAFINMAVSLKLVPAKGMTLPFISYGGSSLVAVGFVVGLALALSRRRPRALRFTELRPREAFA